MTREEFAVLLDTIQADERAVREAGQKEYAHDESNAFANFERWGKALNLTREQVLLVYAAKHWDGIVAWVNGHRSQREDVRGRLKDLRMYLALLWGMVEEMGAVSIVPICTSCHQPLGALGCPARDGKLHTIA
jgi:hypothetical protein